MEERSKHVTTLDPRLFRLRVLAAWDSEYNVFVARCLETGSIVTADDAETVTDMIKEVLEDEITFAVENQNLSNLFSSPAPFEIWAQWRRVAKTGRKPDVIELNIKLKEPLDGEEDLASVEVAQAA
jgi:hypothetical protein